MPTAAPRPCGHPGCGALVRDGSGRCVKHPKAGSFADKKRGNRHERGYGNAWTKLRNVIMVRDTYLCQVCLPLGRVTQAHAVDHIIPKTNDGTDDPDNLQAICKSCHTIKTAVESAMDGGPAAPEPKWLKRPVVPVVAVCGAPGSGKSYYVAEHAGAHDLVLDLDVIASKLFKLPMYRARIDQMMVALRYRNNMLSSLCARDTQYKKAWLIVTAGTPDKRTYWRDHYGASMVVMPTSKAECIERIRLDERRRSIDLPRIIDVVHAWH